MKYLKTNFSNNIQFYSDASIDASGLIFKVRSAPDAFYKDNELKNLAKSKKFKTKDLPFKTHFEVPVRVVDDNTLAYDRNSDYILIVGYNEINAPIINDNLRDVAEFIIQKQYNGKQSLFPEYKTYILVDKKCQLN